MDALESQWEKNIQLREQAAETVRKMKEMAGKESSRTQKEIEDYTSRVTSNLGASHEDITEAINAGRSALDLILEAKSKCVLGLDKVIADSEAGAAKENN